MSNQTYRTGVARIPLSLGVGEEKTLEITGCNVTVESSPDNTSAGCPLLRFDTDEGDGVPAFDRATYRTTGFHRIIVTNGATAGDLYLLVYGPELVIEFPYHA